MVSKFVYKNKLKSEEGNCGASHTIKPFEPIVLVDTSDSEKRFSKQNGHSHANSYNAKIIHDLLVYIDSFDEVKNYTVGVITGYLSQVNELERMLRGKKFKNIVVPEDFRKASEKELVISTVDKFQGSEKDIIIFDVVKSEVNGTLGFLAMENRINVAFSRAQRLMICVGDAKFIKNTPSKTGKKVLLQEFTEFMLSSAQVLASEDIEKLK
jgi:superfamily I DNA and/or RNA helicase